jgi:hypothetical protein
VQKILSETFKPVNQLGVSEVNQAALNGMELPPKIKLSMAIFLQWQWLFTYIAVRNLSNTLRTGEYQIHHNYQIHHYIVCLTRELFN